MRRIAFASLIVLSACGGNDVPPQRGGAPPLSQPAAYRPFSPEGPSLSPALPRSSSSETMGSERSLGEAQEYLQRRERALQEQRQREASPSSPPCDPREYLGLLRTDLPPDMRERYASHYCDGGPTFWHQ
jgi:hypothetical protein